MGTITRYYGTVDGNTSTLVSIDTTPITANESFTIDVFYGGRPVDNNSVETTWLYRYILTYDNISGITLRNTHNVLEYALNGPYPLTSSISGANIDLIVNTGGGSDPAQCITIYDCYLNYS
jgi:hypothetical protein